MGIPVFHDDQHGTAIVVAAATLNALELTTRDIKSTVIVCNGAGAAAIACMDLLIAFGAQRKNIIVCDSKGVIHADRLTEKMDISKVRFATTRKVSALKDAVAGADIFVGLSAAGALSKDMVASMADNPVIFAMANPDPEILPSEVLEVRNDAIVATGRSDFPNQVNNVLCFPFIFEVHLMLALLKSTNQ